MYQIIWTDSAIESLENILAFVMQKWGTQTMLDLDDRIMELIENIKLNPLMFQAIDNTPNLRRCVVNKQVSAHPQFRVKHNIQGSSQEQS